MANAIATIAGFTLPEVDYSGLTTLTSSSDDATDSLDDTTESAKELQKTLMGFDELNVINSSSLTDTVSELTDAFDFDLPEYDFLSGLTETKIAGIVEDMKEWFGLTGDITNWTELMDTRFGHILTAAGGIAAALVLWKIGTGIVTIVSNLASAASIASTSISGVTTAIIGALGFVYGLYAAYEGAKELTGALYGNSSSSLSNALLNLVGGVAVSATAGAIIGGPIGAVVGGLAAIVVGIATLITQEDAYIKRTVLEDNFSNKGVKVSELTTALQNLYQPYTDYITKQQDLNSQLETAKTRFNDANAKVAALLKTLETRTTLDSTDIDTMSAAFDELFDSFSAVSELQFESVFNGLYQAIQNNLGEKAQTEIANMITQLQSLKKELDIAVSADQARVNEIISSASTTGSLSSSQISELNTIYARIAQSTISQDESVSSLNLLLNKLSESGFSGDFESLSSDLSDIQSQYEKIVNGIELSAQEQKDALAAIKSSAAAYGIDTSGLDWNAISGIFDTSAQQMISEISSKYQSVIQTVSKQVSAMSTEDYEQYLAAYGSTFEGILTSLGGLSDLLFPDSSTIRAEQYASSQIAEQYGDINDLLSQLISEISENIQVVSQSNSAANYSSDRSNFLNGIGLYASGGFPDSGELYMARENGISEYIGAMGNRTAVANNDQIVDGISEGVYSAVTVAMRNLGSNDSAPFIIELDGDAIYQGVVKKDKQTVKRTGQSAFAN